MNALLLLVLCCFISLETTWAWIDMEAFIQNLVKHYDPMTTTIVYNQDDVIDHMVCKDLSASCVGYNQHGLEEVANKLNDLRTEGYGAPLLFSDGNHSNLISNLNATFFVMGGPVFMEVQHSANVAQLRLDNNIIFIDQREVEIELWEKFMVGKDKLISSQVGSWSMGKGLNITAASVFERRDNLHGITLRNGIMSWKPLIDYVKDDNGR